MKRGGDPQRPVERGGEVDLVAGSPGPDGGLDRRRRCRRSGRSSGRSGPPRRATRARRDRPPTRPAPAERRSARAAHRIASSPATGSSQSSIPTGSSTRSAASASSRDQAPLASIRIAICGPAKARTAARRPASSPIADLHLDVAEALGAGLGRLVRRRRTRSAAAIVQLTATGERPARRPSSRHTGSRVRRPARSHSARSIAASAWGRTVASAHAASDVGDRRHVGIGLEHRAAVLQRRPHVRRR